MERILSLLKKILPAPLLSAARGAWHPLIAFASGARYGFPARGMTIIGVTGTKGKSTVAEMLFTILRHAGHTTALASTIRFAVGDDSTPNRFKMTMQGRGFLQRFLADAKRKGATHAVVEITSEGARQYRNAFLFLDGLIVTNIHKEHIESHGSFENYVAAKRGIVRSLERSPKKNRALIANTDNEHTKPFLETAGARAVPFSARELEGLVAAERAASFSYGGMSFTAPLPGAFNAMNALSAIKMAEQLGIPLKTCSEALANMCIVRGRLERIDRGQPFAAIVDYAHTPDSLEALYSAFPNRRKICVLGNTGGGRDQWKRPLMGEIADRDCEAIILTNEDPYDEDPRAILDAMAAGMKRPPIIELDRRTAIRRALSEARAGDAVLISGKGTDPYIMEAGGKKTPWDDATVVREELAKLGFAR